MRMEGSLAQSGPRASQPSLVLTACLTWLGPGHPPQLQGFFFFFLSFFLGRTAQLVGSSSPTRDQTRALSSEGLES